jgi:Mannosyltransferase (PIG-V)
VLEECRPVSEGFSYAERLRAALPLEHDQRAALRHVWSAFWLSRAVCWGIGVLAVLAVGAAGETVPRLDPYWVTIPFDETFANLLAAPGARWDSVWFLEIAQHGYGYSDRAAAFFPLYPALVSVAGPLGPSLILGLVVSCACAIGGLYLLHRLVELDFGLENARTVVSIVAWFPSAVVLSAVYSEGLFLLLSVGSIYAARIGRWPMAGMAGAFAAATRSSGILLVIPLLVLYLYGPRSDRPRHGMAAAWPPRHRLAPDVLWIGAIPAGVVAYLGYLSVATGEPLSAFSEQGEWTRTVVPVVGGVALGAWKAIVGVAELVPGVGGSGGVAPGQIPELVAARDMALFGFLVLALWLVRESVRRLPAAYSAWAISGLLLPLSVPALDEPLRSLPRFMLVLFPLWIALALWARERERVRRILIAMGSLLVLSSALFTTWVYAP